MSSRDISSVLEVTRRYDDDFNYTGIEWTLAQVNFIPKQAHASMTMIIYCHCEAPAGAAAIHASLGDRINTGIH